MSLGSWFRDYVYIPLGGNRVPKARWMFNIFIVWMLTGLWHGAAWNFVMWGLFFAVLLMLEKLCINKILKKLPVFIQHIYVILLVILSFVIFNAADMKEVFEDICSMFGAGGLPLLTSETMYYLRSYAVVLIFGIIGCTPITKNIICIIKQKTSGMTLVVAAEALLLICQLLVITGYLVDGSFNPFLYFRF